MHEEDEDDEEDKDKDKWLFTPRCCSAILRGSTPSMCTLLLSPNVYVDCRAARSEGIGELDSLIAKDLIDSEDPKHTQFCSEIAFVAICVLSGDDISIL